MTSYFGYDPDTLEHSAFDLFLHQGNVPEGLPASLLRSTSNERISLLPSSTALATLERQSPGKSGLGLVVSKAWRSSGRISTMRSSTARRCSAC